MSSKLEFSGFIIDVEILPSATKHGINEEDILYSLGQSIHNETLQTDPNKTLSIGFDSKARLLEIIFHVISGEYIVVFHAMPCRKIYIERMLG